MRAAWRLALLSLSIVAVGGCGLAGTWKVDDFVPYSVKKNFEIGQITFRTDGTYVADMSYSGREKESKGTYTYDAKTQMLTFKSGEGKTREYQALLHGDHLHMWNTGVHKEWMVFLARTHAAAAEKKSDAKEPKAGAAEKKQQPAKTGGEIRSGY